jgi:hypothetical protein
MVRIVHALAVIALILCIVGATDAAVPQDIDTQTEVHAGVILYAVVYVMLSALTAWVWLRNKRLDEGAVLIALPFLLIRLIYSLFSSFANSSVFGTATGSTTAALFMSTFEEMIVVVIYLATGLKLATVPKDHTVPRGETSAHRTERGDFQFGRMGLLSTGVAAILTLKHNIDTNRRHPDN